MSTLAIPVLRRAIESRDGDSLAGFYADDAVLRIIDHDNPPASPQEIKGRNAIASYYADVCGRTAMHRVNLGFAEGDRLAFIQTCTYPDGRRVFLSATLQLAGGKIARQVSVQASNSTFNIVRFRVKPGENGAFLDAYRTGVAAWPGLLRGVIIRTDERNYCLMGEWPDTPTLAEARGAMLATLDSIRDVLESLGGERVVSDTVSGSVVLNLKG